MGNIIGPSGRVFEEEVEATNRILNKGIPFIIVDVKEKVLTTKEGDYFLLTTMEGDIPENNTRGFGFYYQDTRFLSCFEFRVCDRIPVFLASTVEASYLERVECTNPDLQQNGVNIPQETLNIRQLRLIHNGLSNRVRVENFNAFPVELKLQFKLDSDFADIFEVRGLKRETRGKLLCPQMEGKTLTFAYLGLDDVFRRTEVHFSLEPSSVNFNSTGASLEFNLKTEANSKSILSFSVVPVVGSEKPRLSDNYKQTLSELEESYNLNAARCLRIETDNSIFNRLMKRSKDDIRMLETEMGHGRMIAAGVPWFVSPFGRDSAIVAIQTLSLCSELARDVIKFLVLYQGKTEDVWRDEEPGKILHELRRGELANIKEIPHTPYYGSIDSTPLFLILVSEYFKWTGDVDFLRSIKPNLSAAIDWIKNYGDKDGDLFVEYERKAKRGLANQGWKDSYSAVSHLDGLPAQAPIALVEAQGYVYYALMRMGEIYSILGDEEKSISLISWASALKSKFIDHFWMEGESFLAMALDGDKNQVKSITSNPGQVLWTGILDLDKAKAVKDRLMAPDMFSGWGIRTLSKLAKNYNPMSYHNGSVWPHDNAIIARGFKRYGFNFAVETVATGMFETAVHHPYSRLPELFCGFTRKGEGWPIDYPVACTPQAWAAGSMFMILQAMLGLSPDAKKGVLYVNSPTLPPWLKEVKLLGLKVGSGSLDISFIQRDNITSFMLMKKEGKVTIIMEE